jgi:flavorubredoxin
MNPTPLSPQHITDDTYLITELFPAMPGTVVPVSSVVITGPEPVIVDTGTGLNRHAWTEAVFSLVDPRDVRWIYLSHDDHDHVGNLAEVMATCTNATLVGNWFMRERLAGDLPLPLHRMRWVNHGETFSVGDRELLAYRPPIFDAPTTRGLYDPKTGFYWAGDSFAALVTPDMPEGHDLDADLFEGTFRELNRQVSPWQALVAPEKQDAVLRALATLDLRTVVGAHGPVLRGAMIERGFDLLRELPSMPDVEWPGQATLDELVGGAVAAPTIAAA